MNSDQAVGMNNIAAEAERIFNLQQKFQYQAARSTAAERRAKLQLLHNGIIHYRQALRDAMFLDFKKPAAEVDISEIYPVTSEIKNSIKHLQAWMRPAPVSNPIMMTGSSCYVHQEPKGVVLILSPWNYPVNLTLAPLVLAIAAGNTVILKPSEHTPHTSKVLKQLIEELFDEREVALLEGAVETSQALLNLPFNHIFFTGSPVVGKLVMEAAAKHLASVTLELGGKSPTIIDETADLANAAKRITWSKFINAGQTCIAPDYLWVHASRKVEFLKNLQTEVEAFYGSDPIHSADYARIINQKHYDRLKDYYEEAIRQGAQIELGGRFDDEQRYIAPTVLTNVSPDSGMMQNEIFGPILPVFTFDNLDEPMRMVNSKEKALALYIFSKRNKNIARVMSETRAGTSCINHVAIHFGHHNLPFGGSNHSGIGKSHGIYGFREFSNARSVFRQRWPVSSADLITAPYNRWKQKLIDMTIKWF